MAPHLYAFSLFSYRRTQTKHAIDTVVFHLPFAGGKIMRSHLCVDGVSLDMEMVIRRLQLIIHIIIKNYVVAVKWN